MKLLFGPDVGDFEVYALHGRVVGERTWSETQIHSHTTHSTTYSDYGASTSSTTSVYGTPTTRNRVFLELPDGKQAQVDYVGNFGALPGHPVSVVRVRYLPTGAWQNARLRNHATDADSWQPGSAISGHQYVRGAILVTAFLFALGAIPIALWLNGDADYDGVGDVNGQLLAAGIAAAVLFVLMVAGRRARMKRMIAKIQGESDALIASYRPTR